MYTPTCNIIIISRMASMLRDRAYRSTTNAERNEKKNLFLGTILVCVFYAKGVNNNNTSTAEGRSYCNNMQIQRSNIWHYTYYIHITYHIILMTMLDNTRDNEISMSSQLSVLYYNLYNVYYHDRAIILIYLYT